MVNPEKHRSLACNVRLCQEALFVRMRADFLPASFEKLRGFDDVTHAFLLIWLGRCNIGQCFVQVELAGKLELGKNSQHVFDEAFQHRLVLERAALFVMDNKKLHWDVLGHLDEDVAGHFADARKALLGKLNEFLHNGLQEERALFQETLVLRNDVHNAGGYHRLVLRTLPKRAIVNKAAKEEHKDVALLLLRHRSSEAADRPGKRAHPLVIAAHLSNDLFELVLNNLA